MSLIVFRGAGARAAHVLTWIMLSLFENQKVVDGSNGISKSAFFLSPIVVGPSLFICATIGGKIRLQAQTISIYLEMSRKQMLSNRCNSAPVIMNPEMACRSRGWFWGPKGLTNKCECHSRLCQGMFGLWPMSCPLSIAVLLLLPLFSVSCM